MTLLMRCTQRSQTHRDRGQGAGGRGEGRERGWRVRGGGALQTDMLMLRDNTNVLDAPELDG